MKISSANTYQVWAISEQIEIGYHRYLLGKLCWDPEARLGPIPIALFSTREEARAAQKTCCYKPTRVERVRVTIEVIEEAVT